MDSTGYDCTICLEVCEDAVESACCVSLYCEKCTSGLQTCPSCMQNNFRIIPSRYTRKMIGRMTVACDKCGLQVQRDNLLDHANVCEMRDLKCAALDCGYKGSKEEFLHHLIKCHTEDLLSIGQRLNKPHAFQATNVSTAIQTSMQNKNCGTQTDFQHDCTIQTVINDSFHSCAENDFSDYELFVPANQSEQNPIPICEHKHQFYERQIRTCPCQADDNDSKYDRATQLKDSGENRDKDISRPRRKFRERCRDLILNNSADQATKIKGDSNNKDDKGNKDHSYRRAWHSLRDLVPSSSEDERGGKGKERGRSLNKRQGENCKEDKNGESRRPRRFRARKRPEIK